MIKLERVNYSVGDRAILRDVSLRVDSGRLSFLVGASGAGKTSLLRLCRGEVIAQSGDVALCGDDPAGLSRDARAALRQKIGLVPQNPKFLDHLDVRENVSLPLKVNKPLTSQDQKNVDDLIAWVGLGKVAHSYPRDLPRSACLRLALARAAILSPQVLLADAPDEGLEREEADQFIKLLNGLSYTGTAILVATRDHDLVRRTAETAEIAVLRLVEGELRIS